MAEASAASKREMERLRAEAQRDAEQLAQHVRARLPDAVARVLEAFEKRASD